MSVSLRRRLEKLEADQPDLTPREPTERELVLMERLERNIIEHPEDYPDEPLFRRIRERAAKEGAVA